MAVEEASQVLLYYFPRTSVAAVGVEFCEVYAIWID
jgi:hypothetical protein